MDKQEKVIPKGYWEDAGGNLVPVSKIKDVDKLRHKVVVDMCEAAKKLHDALVEFKLASISSVAEFAQSSAAEYGVQLRGAAGKGNITLISFDGRFKVQRQMAEMIAFDERLQVAKAKIDECIHMWSKGANANLKVLVNQAFETDKEGNVSVGKILSLRRFNISDPDWDIAMQAISDSIRVTSSKAYVRFYERNDLTGDYEAISLDMAKV